MPDKTTPDPRIELYIKLCAEHYLGKPHREHIRALAHSLLQSGMVPQSCASQDLQDGYQQAIKHNTLDIQSFAVDIVTVYLLSDATHSPLYHHSMHEAWKVCHPRRSDFFSPWHLSVETTGTPVS
ncbi:hypothetical protein [Deinococcus roseus]|uniref:Uncharacterized protein n=1 Tax=Deinococcus roseus TaxID=392414 RepID=A0ABQ2DGP8_9DEIO|nr:hypothetical protein [Deinococcus roseus]GGJ55630.1 hypothetical protein GCM10008938_47250 [Deinococcus roseus]